jgi:hypothetical protein
MQEAVHDGEAGAGLQVQRVRSASTKIPLPRLLHLQGRLDPTQRTEILMRKILVLSAFLTGCPSTKTAPTYPADRWDDMHPEEAGLKSSTPVEGCEPECLFAPEGTGDE